MCTLFLFINHFESFPILLISNRDEYRGRKARMINGWNHSLTEYGNSVFSPRDDSKRGTWFACQNKIKTRWAIITNIRDLRSFKKDLRSRGEIIPHFLSSNLNCSDYVKYLEQNNDNYNYFNLIFSDSETIYYYNSKEKLAKKIANTSTKEKYIYGLSNGSLDEKWPKVVENKSKFLSFVNSFQNRKKSIADLWNYFKNEMMNSKKYELSLLPKTGVSEEQEIFLSSLFISGKEYGTRTTILFAISQDESLNIFEQSYNNNALIDEEKIITAKFFR
ncbi:NRDE family protein [Pigmentibacter sp. JX0631]|uniref:NRDE family protein n=1 Tax=Pigmentibacter sp. JX0631 TaxID=2976982 RepID=UPI002468C380|nr:NRDE family protein [Pigmentibacter sp. JX0631]WGL61279.1 NRDE family protein [Pigmentibacter sp. JX0631]